MPLLTFDMKTDFHASSSHHGIDAWSGNAGQILCCKFMCRVKCWMTSFMVVCDKIFVSAHFLSQFYDCLLFWFWSKREKQQKTKKKKGNCCWRTVCLLVACLTSQQQASVSQGRICSDNFMCCHTEIEAADQTFYLTQSQYTDTGPTSPSADPITPGVG